MIGRRAFRTAPRRRADASGLAAGAVQHRRQQQLGELLLLGRRQQAETAAGRRCATSEARVAPSSTLSATPRPSVGSAAHEHAFGAGLDDQPWRRSTADQRACRSGRCRRPSTGSAAIAAGPGGLRRRGARGRPSGSPSRAIASARLPAGCRSPGCRSRRCRAARAERSRPLICSSTPSDALLHRVIAAGYSRAVGSPQMARRREEAGVLAGAVVVRGARLARRRGSSPSGGRS